MFPPALSAGSRSVRALVSSIALLATASVAGAQVRLYVDASAPPGGDGQSWSTAFHSLHDALEVARDNTPHELWVARGTYSHTTHFTLRFGDAIYGGFDGTETQRDQRDPAQNPTILDGLLDHRVVNGGWDTLVDGVTVRNGRDEFKGAGMRFAGGGRVTIRNVLFENNVSGDDGGALSASNDELIVLDCTFRDNSATHHDGDNSGGGAVRFYDGVGTFENCVFDGNSAQGEGGAVSNYEGEGTYRRCSFVGNVSQTAAAVYTYHGTPTFERCLFEGNMAQSVGAVRTRDGQMTIRECEFRGNTANGGAGAVYTYDGPLTAVDSVFVGNQAGGAGGAVRAGGPLEVVGCRFVSNSAETGGGVRFAGPGQPLVVNCEFRGNVASDAGGAFYGARMTAIQSTFAGNQAPVGGACRVDGVASIASSIVTGPGAQLAGEPVVSFSLVEGGYPGAGNLSGDPMFVDAAGGDLRLAAGSPCVDAASRSHLPADSLDVDGDGDTDEALPLDAKGRVRDADAGPDMGAYESDLGCGRGESFCEALPNASGQTARIFLQGSPRLAAGGFRLAVHGAVPGASGLFVYGSQETQLPFANGYRCLGRMTHRLGAPLVTDGDGAAERSAPLPSTGPGAIQPGSTWSFQFWYADPLPAGNGINTSDGVRVRFCP